MDPARMNISTCADSAYYLPCFCRYFRGNRLKIVTFTVASVNWWPLSVAFHQGYLAVVVHWMFSVFLHWFDTVTIGCGERHPACEKFAPAIPPPKKKIIWATFGGPVITGKISKTENRKGRKCSALSDRRLLDRFDGDSCWCCRFATTSKRAPATTASSTSIARRESFVPWCRLTEKSKTSITSP